MRFFVSAAAALDRNVAQWFDAVGITVLEGYGLTETAAASFINRPNAYRFGTVGWPFPATEVKIADDGEILLRGPGVMTSYHDLPEATAEALDPDGWFHTGDIGEIDAEGFLRITDRKKDMFKTSQGKYVAPSPIEVRFKGLCPYVGEILVIGEARPVLRGVGQPRQRSDERLGCCAWFGWQVLRRVSARRKDTGTHRRIHRHAELGTESLGADQEIRDPRPRTLDRIRRPDAEHEAPPQGRRREVRGRHFGSLRVIVRLAV